MNFNSLEFLLFFLPVCYLCVTVTPEKYTRLCLLIASLVFYGIWYPPFLFILVGSILVNHCLAKFTYQNIWVLSLGVISNICLLIYYKYFTFLIQNINWIAGVELEIPHIILPLAISFFTFQQIAFLIDAYARKSLYSMIEYAGYIAFFPQLIAGPIVHHYQLIPQLRKKAVIANSRLIAFVYIAVGLFKKVVLADFLLAPTSDVVFARYAAGGILSVMETWLGVLAYLFQIYFDFSGYCDIAIGLSALFGVKMILNFYSPYKADSIIEFWRRWHISLSEFLKEYIYIPLGGNRLGIGRSFFNIVIVMCIGGLWHGPAWTFVLWGIFHGMLIIGNHFIRIIGIFPKNTFIRLLGHTSTILCVTLGWVLFRAETFESAMSIYAQMFSFDFSLYKGQLFFPDLWNKIIYLFICAFIAFCLPNIHEYLRGTSPLFSYRDFRINDRSLLRLAKPQRWSMCVITVLFITAVLQLSRNNTPFLYFQF